LKRDAQYEDVLSEESSSEPKEFKMAVIVDGQRFLGSGRNKRTAKIKAAQLALEKLFGMCFDKEGKKLMIISTLTFSSIVHFNHNLLEDRLESIEANSFFLPFDDKRFQLRIK
jgi:hypothetical protein